MTARSRAPRFSRRRILGACLGFGAAALAACRVPSAPTAVPAKTAEKQPAAPTVGGPAAAAKPTEAPKPASASAASGGGGAKIIVRLNGIDPPGQEFANKWIADYNRTNNLAVEIDYTDWGTSFQKITTGIAAGTAPDIFMGGGLWHGVIPAKGGSLELDPYIKSYKDWEDYYDVPKKDVTVQGKVVAIPYRQGGKGNIFLRKSLFEKAGLDPTKPPATWDDAQQMAAKVTQKAGDKWDVAGWHFWIGGDCSQQYEDALFQMGSGYFNDDRTKPTNNTPEGVEAMQFWVTFVEKGMVPKQGMDSGVPNMHAYTAGKIALFPGSPQDVLNAKLNAPAIWADTIVAAPLKRRVQAQQLFVDKYFIYKRTKVPDLSWALLEQLVSPSVNEKIVIEGSWGGPVRKAAEAAEVYKDPRWRTMIASLKLGRPRQVVPQHFDVQPAMSRQFEAAVKGAKSVKDALKDMDDEVAKILKG